MDLTPDQIQQTLATYLGYNVIDELLAELERMWAAFSAAIDRWFSALYLSSPWLWTLTLLALVILLVLLLWHIFSIIRGVLLATAELGSESAEEEPPPGSREHLQYAESLAESGDYVDAVRELFVAGALHLEERHAIPHRRAETNREYLARVALARPQAVPALSAIAALVDEKWYGMSETSESEYAHARASFTELQAR